MQGMLNKLCLTAAVQFSHFFLLQNNFACAILMFICITFTMYFNSLETFTYEMYRVDP